MTRILFVFPLAALAFAQRGPMHVAPEALTQHVSFLSSDALEGRRSPSKGLDAAAAYIASWFRRIGLEAPVDGSYFQLAKPTLRRQREEADFIVPIMFKVKQLRGTRNIYGA